MAVYEKVLNTDGQSTKANVQKVNKHKRMESEVPVFRMSMDKVQMVAIR